MIDEKTFLQLATEAKAAITDGRLSDTLLLLRPLTNSVGNNHLSDERETIEADYERLLQFMQTGGKDDTRTEQHLRLLQKAISLLQDTRRLRRLGRLGDIYSHTWSRLTQHWEDGVDNAIATLERGLTINAEDTAFNLIWTAPQLTHEAKDIILRFLERSDNEYVPYYISALTLSLLEYFDAPKLDLLLKYCQSADIQLRSRALVGACVASQLHSGYIALYPELCDKFTRLRLNDEIAVIQHNFCLYQETDRIQHTIQLYIRGKKTQKEVDRDTKKMMDMYNDGIDINLNTLGTLKKFPFFGEPCHWFLPFKGDGQSNEATAFLNKLDLCDSDKHSLNLMFDAMPQTQRNEMRQHIKDTLPNFAEISNNGGGHTTEQAYRNVIQCLCRCLLHSPWSAEWPVVFSPQMMFIANPILRPCIKADKKYLAKIGHILRKYKHYADAKRHFLLQLETEGGTARIFSALAKCEEKEGNAQKAANYYRQAALVSPGEKAHLWNLQLCLRELGQHEARLDCLTELEELFPDDSNVLYECGLCLMKLGRWQEAKGRFFRLEFSDRAVVQSVRAIAWCALQMCDLKLAHSYYDRLLDRSCNIPTWEDYLNYAHTLWLQGDIPKALELYQQYIHTYITTEQNVKAPLSPFDKDKDMLVRLGIQPSDICLMHDIIARGSGLRTAP